MRKKFYQNEKFQGIFFPILYLFLSIGIVITGCIIFYNNYYQPILVDGISMKPTLIGGGYAKTATDGTVINYRYHYGIADLHKSAVNSLNRFDVCITYYPKSWPSDDDASIIKRVWGFPGETINMSYNSTDKEFTYTVRKNDKLLCEYKAPVVEITRKYEAEYTKNGQHGYTTVSESFTAAKFNVGIKIFYTNVATSSYRTFTKTLQSNEYFVMGDNWAGSSDSYTNISETELLTKNYLQGRAVCISGYASSQGNKAVHIHKYKQRYKF